MSLSRRIRLVIIVIASFAACMVHAQEKYELSVPLDLKTTGCNRVICMKNGYTLLFHFDVMKPLVVKVFDSKHKPVVSKEHPCRVMDITMLRATRFKGLYDIGGEAVMFIEQERLGHRELVRMRFSATTGDLVDEKVLGESKSINKPTYFYVMKNKQEEGYAILFVTDASQFRESQIHVSYFNVHHDITREIPIDVNRKDYDYLLVTGAESQPNGICISFGLSKLLQNETVHNGDYDGAANIYEHTLHICYIPKDATTVKTKVVKLSTEIYPYYADYTYNPFTKSLNVLMFSYKDALMRAGLEWRPVALMSDLFFRIDEESFVSAHKWIENAKANEYLKQNTDTNRYFDGLPLKTFTNENGLSTMISQTFSRYDNVETRARPDVFETFLNDIAITQFDDDGNEIWGTVLPFAQYNKSYKHYYQARDLAKRWQELLILDDLPQQCYDRQFFSFNTYNKDKNYYIVFNDNNKNFNSTLRSHRDTVYDFAQTNVCYYSINRKREVTRKYLLGDPVANEYRSSFIEGADFDEQTGTYATLVQIKKADDISFRLAWAKLD